MTHARGGRNDRKKTQNPNGNYSVIAYSHGHSTTNRRAARAAIHGGADRTDCVVRRDDVEDYITVHNSDAVPDDSTVQLHHELSSSLDALTGQGVRQSVGGGVAGSGIAQKAGKIKEIITWKPKRISVKQQIHPARRM